MLLPYSILMYTGCKSFNPFRAMGYQKNNALAPYPRSVHYFFITHGPSMD